MVQRIKVNSSNERYDNKSDESRVFDIEANVVIEDGVAIGIENGLIEKDGEEVAKFSSRGSNRISISYKGVDVNERNRINEAVDLFIVDVKNAVLTDKTNV